MRPSRRSLALSLSLLSAGCSAAAPPVGQPTAVASAAPDAASSLPSATPPAPSASASAAPAASASLAADAAPPAPPPPPGPARVLWALVPVDNTGYYRLLVVPGAPLVVLGENLTHVSSPDDMFIEALGDDGASLWVKAGTAKWEHGISGTADHFFFVSEFTGKLDFEGARAYASETAVLVARMSAAGALAWGKVLASASYTRTSGLAATPDGGVVTALGIFAPAKEGPLAVRVAGGQDAILVKHDAAGQVAWAHTFGWRGYDEARAVRADAEGNITVAGTRWKSPDTWMTSLEGGVCHGWVAKLGPDGKERWLVDVGTDTTRVTIQHLTAAANGTIFVAGRTTGKSRLGAIELDAGPKERAFLASLDKDGHVLWARLHDPVDCLTVDAADRLVVAGNKAVTIETATEAATILAFEREAVSSITSCHVDGARHLFLSGMAAPAAKIGDKQLGGPARKRPRTSWLHPYETGFVAKLAL